MTTELVYRGVQLRQSPAQSETPEDRVFTLTASTQDLDSHDSIVEASWDLERYQRNPVVLWDHNFTFDSGTLPIGTMRNLKVNENNELVGELVLASEKANPKAEQVYQLIKEGILRGVSVGFYPRDVRFEKRDNREIMILSNNELREISITPVPSNPNALIQLRSRAKGNPVKTKKDPTTKAAPPMSDYENACAYILGAVDESGIPEDQKEPLKTDLKARMDECMQAGETESADESKSDLERILKAVGAKSVDAAIVVIEALQERGASLPSVEKSLESDRLAKLIADGERAGKVTPAIKKKDSWKRAVAKGFDAVKEAIDLLPRATFLPDDTEPDEEPEVPAASAKSAKSTLVRLTAEDEALCKREGIDPKKFLERKRALIESDEL
ncbi:MAG: hypothetical protein E6R03_04765 [Hyphomicrobiaceae bacterium]|nr:MAG: hypothetical protein E6R03_04765 [Hyphomicrobiaceae bacterium]